MAVRQVTVFNLSELDDDSYEYDDGTSFVHFRCFKCNANVEGFIKHGLVMDATCHICGEIV